MASAPWAKDACPKSFLADEMWFGVEINLGLRQYYYSRKSQNTTKVFCDFRAHPDRPFGTGVSLALLKFTDTKLIYKKRRICLCRPSLDEMPECIIFNMLPLMILNLTI